jgi:hypothetical protein
MTTSNSPPQGGNTSQPSKNQPAAITPELVKKVAARVYALLLADLKTERERHPFSSQKLRKTGGGRNGV